MILSPIFFDSLFDGTAISSNKSQKGLETNYLFADLMDVTIGGRGINKHTIFGGSDNPAILNEKAALLMQQSISTQGGKVLLDESIIPAILSKLSEEGVLSTDSEGDIQSTKLTSVELVTLLSALLESVSEKGSGFVTDDGKPVKLSDDITIDEMLQALASGNTVVVDIKTDEHELKFALSADTTSDETPDLTVDLSLVSFMKANENESDSNLAFYVVQPDKTESTEEQLLSLLEGESSEFESIDLSMLNSSSMIKDIVALLKKQLATDEEDISLFENGLDISKSQFNELFNVNEEKTFEVLAAKIIEALKAELPAHEEGTIELVLDDSGLLTLTVTKEFIEGEPVFTLETDNSELQELLDEYAPDIRELLASLAQQAQTNPVVIETESSEADYEISELESGQKKETTDSKYNGSQIVSFEHLAEVVAKLLESNESGTIKIDLGPIVKNEAILQVSTDTNGEPIIRIHSESKAALTMIENELKFELEPLLENVSILKYVSGAENADKNDASVQKAEVAAGNEVQKNITTNAELVDKLKAFMNSDDKEIIVTSKEFGELRIKKASDENGNVKLIIQAENAESKEALITLIKTNNVLKSSGLTVQTPEDIDDSGAQKIPQSEKKTFPVSGNENNHTNNNNQSQVKVEGTQSEEKTVPQKELKNNTIPVDKNITDTAAESKAKVKNGETTDNKVSQKEVKDITVPVDNNKNSETKNAESQSTKDVQTKEHTEKESIDLSKFFTKISKRQSDVVNVSEEGQSKEVKVLSLSELQNRISELLQGKADKTETVNVQTEQGEITLTLIKKDGEIIVSPDNKNDVEIVKEFLSKNVSSALPDKVKVEASDSELKTNATEQTKDGIAQSKVTEIVDETKPKETTEMRSEPVKPAQTPRVQKNNNTSETTTPPSLPKLSAEAEEILSEINKYLENIDKKKSGIKIETDKFGDVTIKVETVGNEKRLVVEAEKPQLVFEEIRAHVEQIVEKVNEKNGEKATPIVIMTNKDRSEQNILLANNQQQVQNSDTNIKVDGNAEQQGQGSGEQQNTQQQNSNNEHNKRSNTTFQDVIRTTENTVPEEIPKTKGADKEKIVKDIELIKEIGRFIRKGESTGITIRIHPEHLGRVKIQLEMAEKIVKAHIEVESVGAKQILESNISQLMQQANQNGQQLHSVHISLNSGEARQQKQAQKDRKESGSDNESDSSKEAGKTGSTERTEKRMGYNTYEYLA